ncbi:MAG: ABC transporter permease, partial [Chloroflexota bacterium]|nr:ABC transporter permease [Chloroflexota bacterium]
MASSPPAVLQPVAVTGGLAPRTSRRARRWLASNSLVVIGAAILTLATIAAIFAPLIVPIDPLRPDLLGRLKPPLYQSPSGFVHLLGTDNLGRDLLSRTIYGARISLIVGFFSVFGAGVLGVVLGLIAGYYGGLVDDLIMRVADIQQSFPYLALALALVAVIGAGLVNLIVVLGVT